MESKLKIPVSMIYNAETGTAKFKYVNTTKEEFRKAIQTIFSPCFKKGGCHE